MGAVRRTRGWQAPVARAAVALLGGRDAPWGVRVSACAFAGAAEDPFDARRFFAGSDGTRMRASSRALEREPAVWDVVAEPHRSDAQLEAVRSGPVGRRTARRGRSEPDASDA